MTRGEACKACPCTVGSTGAPVSCCAAKPLCVLADRQHLHLHTAQPGLAILLLSCCPHMPAAATRYLLLEGSCKVMCYSRKEDFTPVSQYFAQGQVRSFCRVCMCEREEAGGGRSRELGWEGRANPCLPCNGHRRHCCKSLGNPRNAACSSVPG